ncbi:MAG: HAD family hydrolase [Candidatus Riflebacteria bacterium]|nr:HAD family hydrolase [Candidatus Riflebacteria bacterium]
MRSSRFWMLILVLVLTRAPLAAEWRPADWSLARPTPRSNAVLGGVLATTRELAAKGRRPVNVFDLDGTLFETGSRHKAAMLKFARQNQRRYPDLRAKLERWVPEQLPYEISDTFDELGIRNAADREAAMRLWKECFHSNEGLHLDRPLPGAREYVNKLHKAGSTIVYLTGRKIAQQQKGSLEVLAEKGFPVPPERCALIMNPRTGLHDTMFKGSAAVREQIAALGEVVAVFDNEPGNVNVLAKSFPSALMVFLDTNHSPAAPPLDTGIPGIRNFRWGWLQR